jgi:transcriptional regulator with XRE-family HTH domain
MEFFNKNIRYLREQSGWTQKELAARVDVKVPVIGAYEEFRSIPPIPMAVKIADVFNVDLDTLVRKDLGKDVKRKSNRDKFLRGRDVLAITVDSQNKENVELVPYKASAGYLSSYSDPDYIKDLPKIQIPSLSKSSTFRGFEIKGDSMLPVKTGDVLIGKYVEDLEKIKNSKTYIIVSKNEGIVYKRVFNFLSKNQLLLISDNRVYDPYVMDASDVLEIWAFAGRLTFEEEDPESPGTKTMDFLATKWFENLD